MNILVNCSNLRFGGALQVASSFITECLERDMADVKIYFVCSDNVIDNLNNKIANDKRILRYNCRATVFGAITGINRTLAAIEKKFNIQKVFTIFGPPYWRPKSNHLCGFAKPDYVYNESPYFSTISLKNLLLLKFKKELHLYSFKNHCDSIVTESEEVSKRISIILNLEVFTVTNFYHQLFDELYDFDRYEEDDIINIFMPAAYYPHKNHRIIPLVIKYLNSNYPNLNYKFHLTLNQHEDYFNIKGIERNIVFHGKVNIYELLHLYYKMDYVILPSLLECFSATYCEAMKTEKPILTSDLSFAKNTCKDAAIYFDPLDPKDIGDKIYMLSQNQNLITRLRKNGTKRLLDFDSYEDRTKKYLEILLNHE